MLGRYGQTVVVDWGLALPVERQGIFKESGEHTLLPATGSDSQRLAAGTPAFMSPEQASGNLDLSPATDIYSLGVTLYKILTGKLPYGGQDRLSSVARGVFPRPSQVNKLAPRSLEAICLKAMSLLPQHRYDTALDLSRDIENYLADLPVTAFAEPLGFRFTRWLRRHRALAQALGSLLLLLAVGGFLASGWLARQARREGDLRAAAERARQSEHVLREQGLLVSAQFAARTLANQIDIRWRILEKEAADPRLRDWLAAINADPLDEVAWAPLQAWLDARSAAYPDIDCRSWHVQSRTGVQVARAPSHQPDGTRFGSLGASYAYRDYFHGGGRDYYQEQQFPRAPLRDVHNSVVVESTNDGHLTVIFSAPILGADGEVAGVLALGVELGRFADLRVNLPADAQVLLVETRTYYMQRAYPEPHEERGEGLVLHHQDIQELKSRDQLPHVSDEVVQRMRSALARWRSSGQDDPAVSLLPDGYRDPLASRDQRPWLAAFAPVVVSARPPRVRETGWFVIVEQCQ
jgi:serine/threonine-protein kinase